jgi:hemolysin activation/secretion protein
VSVEKALDELWIGVKGQSNLEISCTLRNNFRVNLSTNNTGVEHWIHKGGYRLTEGNQTPNTGLDAGR